MPLYKNSNYLSTFVSLALFGHLILFFYNFIYGGYFDYQIPIEAREYASISSILSFVNNKNPFSLEAFPLGINAYSAVWPYFLSKIFIFFKISSYENIVFFSRLISFIFFIFFLFFFTIICIKKKITLNVILFLHVYIIISTCLKISLGSWSNGIGLIFYFIGLIIVFDKCSKENFLISSLLFIVSAHLKFYFGIGIIFVLLKYYNHIFTKKYSIVSFLIILLSLLIFFTHLKFFPSFYFVSFFNQINLTGVNNSNLLQFIVSKKFYSEIYFVIYNYFYLFLFLLLCASANKNYRDFIISICNKKNLIKISLIVIFFFIVIFILWPNLGNFGTYSNNLLIPLIISTIINLKTKLQYSKINFFIALVIFLPLSTPIFNLKYPGTLSEFQKMSNSESKRIIDALPITNPTYDSQLNYNAMYTDHFLGNFFSSNDIKYFNGNTLHVKLASIQSFKNKAIRNIFKLDLLEFYYIKNKELATIEINKDYSYIVCVFVCFSDSFQYDFVNDNKSNNNYKLINKTKINNIFGQSYFASIFIKNF